MQFIDRPPVWWSGHIRRIIQCFFLGIVLWTGWEFVRFVGACETSLITAPSRRYCLLTRAALPSNVFQVALMDVIAPALASGALSLDGV